MTEKQIIEDLILALNCYRALDMPYKEGKYIFEKAGFNDSERFDYPATRFAEDKATDAIKNAIDYLKGI